MNKYGMVRLSAISPIVVVGNPKKNIENMLQALKKVPDSQVVVFPELCITGYTCADLFENPFFLKQAERAVREFAVASKDQWNNQRLIFVGAPVPVGNQLFNCAVAINDGKVIGIVPKQNIPTSHEFYEGRWFVRANGKEHTSKTYAGIIDVPFGIDVLFKNEEVIVGAEICEDLWVPSPPSSTQCLAGANILVNLSASNELVGKAEYRRSLVEQQSGRCLAAYVYASAGPTESTDDVVFGGHCLIAENGRVLEESACIGDLDNPMNMSERIITVDVDVEKLQTERRSQTSFRDASSLDRKYRKIHYMTFDKDYANSSERGLKRYINPYPFVPTNPVTLKKRCAEVFGIQCAGLARRLVQLDGGFNDVTAHDGIAANNVVHNYVFKKTPKIVIGVSGGLDSTLALLVAAKTYKALGLDIKGIVGITMPGFGTTDETKNSALKIMDHIGVTSETIDIRETCLQIFKEKGHKPLGIEISGEGMIDYNADDFMEDLAALSDEDLAKGDLVFENVQARQRTAYLMSRGFVLGTGDMSEIAEGWMTYNGDHMSMYCVNAGVPKTLVKHLVRFVAEIEGDNLDVYINENPPKTLPDLLMEIYYRMISAELLPFGKDGKIVQSTEDTLGPYDLIDFSMYGLVREKFAPSKILYLMEHAKFNVDFPRDLMIKTIRTLVGRIFGQHYKRICVPGGPMEGSLSLSPRGYLRWASEIDPELFLEDLENLT